MAQFDVHRLRDGGGLAIDCQSDWHEHLDSRLIVPLVPTANAPRQLGRLHPVIAIAQSELIMATHLATAVRRKELGDVVANLSDRRLEIVGAIDLLITGV